VDADASDVVVTHLYLPGVETGANLQTQGPQGLAEGNGTANGAAPASL